MKISTIKKYIDIITLAKNSNKSLKSYCDENNICYNNVVNNIHNLNKKPELTELEKTLVDLYNSVKVCNKKKENVETDDRAKTWYLRGDDTKITYYCYEIYKKNKNPLTGKFSREEMATIYRLYSYYGDSLTQKSVARHFPDLSLVDFKRVLRAFNIYKANSPFPQHMLEEYDEDTLREIQLREKENSFLRKAEEDAIKNNEKLLKKYAQENIDLKKRLEDKKDFKVNLPKVNPVYITKEEHSSKSLNVYLADIHLGSYTVTGSLFDENRSYGFEEAKRRLTEVIYKIGELGHIEHLNIVMLGDNIDCCGFTGYTARQDHVMPNNMDAKEQGNKFIELIDWFVSTLVINNMANFIKIYSVPEGNHTGVFEYMCVKALFGYLNVKFPDIETTLWEKFYGRFEQNGHVFYCLHGKDAAFMKRPMPLVIDDKTKVMLYEWLMNQGEKGNNIHFIKGDLHSNALSSCKKLDYRNVLSLFGSSDYSNYNYSQNAYGVSYDLMLGNNLVRGTFENM
jgi:hypothetical protein